VQFFWLDTPDIRYLVQHYILDFSFVFVFTVHHTMWRSVDFVQPYVWLLVQLLRNVYAWTVYTKLGLGVDLRRRGMFRRDGNFRILQQNDSEFGVY
jgi:hypothetical protein